MMMIFNFSMILPIFDDMVGRRDVTARSCAFPGVFSAVTSRQCTLTKPGQPSSPMKKMKPLKLRTEVMEVLISN